MKIYGTLNFVNRLPDNSQLVSFCGRFYLAYCCIL